MALVHWGGLVHNIEHIENVARLYQRSNDLSPILRTCHIQDHLVRVVEVLALLLAYLDYQ
jgi:hypothetical protein